MKVRRLAAFVLAALAPWLCAALPTFGAERLLERQRPLSVRWGEVEVSETALVKISKEGTQTTYPNAVGLVFKTRLREEELQGLLDGTLKARSQAVIVGTLYVAARLVGGREAWDRFVLRLQEAAGRLTPSAYEEFLTSTSALNEAAGPQTGEYEIALCTLRPGAPDFEADIHQTIVKTDSGSETTKGTSVYSAGKGHYCGPLREAFQGRAAVDVLTTGFTVDESLEEALDLRVENRLQQTPASCPESARISRKDPPEGATSSSTVSNRDGVVHAELQRRDGDGGDAAYVLVVELRDAALARDLPRARSVLLRWDVARRDMRLGAPPRSLAEDRETLLMGVFCTTETCAPDIDAFRSATTTALGASNELLSAVQVRRMMPLTSFPPDSFTVLCVPGEHGEPTATYCLSNACAKVLNPDEVCGDIASALPD